MWNTTDSKGGGFMNEPNEFPSSSTKRESVNRVQSVIPVVVRQLQDCPEDSFKLFELTPQIVSLIGILREFEVQSTKATYQVEDHTGIMSCVWWLESDTDNSPKLPPVKEGRYVRVYGSLRKQEGQKQLMVLRMMPLDNINELTTHLLEVIHVRLQAEHMGKETANKVKNNPGVQLSNSMSFMNDDDTAVNLDSGLTRLQQRVYNVLKPAKTDRGLHINTIMASFEAHQRKDVKAALEFLMEEGHAYSTVDNDHFKVTECM